MKKTTGGGNENSLPKENLISYHADLQEMLMTCSEYLAMPELSSEEKTFFESTQGDAEKALALINEQLTAHTSPANLKQDLVDLQAQIKTAKPLLAAIKSGEADDKAMETVSGLLVAVDSWLSLVAMTPAPVQAAFGKFVEQLAGNKVVLTGLLDKMEIVQNPLDIVEDDNKDYELTIKQELNFHPYKITIDRSIGLLELDVNKTVYFKFYANDLALQNGKYSTDITFYHPKSIVTRTIYLDRLPAKLTLNLTWPDDAVQPLFGENLPTIDQMLNSQLDYLFGIYDTRDIEEPRYATVDKLGFSFSIPANQVLVKGSNYSIYADEKGSTVKVTLMNDQAHFVFSQTLEVWTYLGSAIIKEITYFLKTGEISIKLGKSIITSSVRANLTDFFQKVFKGVTTDNIFQEENSATKLAQIQHNFFAHMSGGSNSNNTNQNDSNNFASSISFSGTIKFDTDLKMPIGGIGHLVVKGGTVATAAVALQTDSLAKIAEDPSKTIISSISFNTSGIYLTTEKQVQVVFKGITLRYGGDIDIDAVIENKVYKGIKIAEALIKFATVVVVAANARNLGGASVQNQQALKNFTRATKETEILDGITFGYVELKLRELLVQSVKAANPFLETYKIDLESALGLKK